MYIDICIYFYVLRIRSGKDLGTYVVKNILTFVAVVFPEIHSCLSVSSALTFLNKFIGVCLMNDEVPLALSKYL